MKKIIITALVTFTITTLLTACIMITTAQPDRIVDITWFGNVFHYE